LLVVVMALAMAGRLGGVVVLHKGVCALADQTQIAKIVSTPNAFG
jgi:hypothetical protein